MYVSVILVALVAGVVVGAGLVHFLTHRDGGRRDDPPAVAWVACGLGVLAAVVAFGFWATGRLDDTTSAPEGWAMLVDAAVVGGLVATAGATAGLSALRLGQRSWPVVIGTLAALAGCAVMAVFAARRLLHVLAG